MWNDAERGNRSERRQNCVIVTYFHYESRIGSFEMKPGFMQEEAGVYLKHGRCYACEHRLLMQQVSKWPCRGFYQLHSKRSSNTRNNKIIHRSACSFSVAPKMVQKCGFRFGMQSAHVVTMPSEIDYNLPEGREEVG